MKNGKKVKLSTLKVEEAVHKEAAKYCAEKGFKLGFYTTLALKEKLERDKSQPTTN